MSDGGKKTFSSFFKDPDAALEPTEPELPVVRRAPEVALLVDPASSSVSNKRPAAGSLTAAAGRPKSVDISELVDDLVDETPPPNALSSTMELSTKEYHQIVRASEALRLEDFSFDGNDPFDKDPFDRVDDAPGIARANQVTVKCKPLEPTRAPRPITLAGDQSPSAPADVTLDGEPEDFEDFGPMLSEPPRLPQEASLDDIDNLIAEAIDPFGLGAIDIEVQVPTGEWTAPEISTERLPTRATPPNTKDVERARELYIAALEELALQRRTAALVHARLAMGYDPDNQTYKAFCDDITKMLGVPDDVSASGTLPVLDADILSWEGDSRG